MAEETLQVKQFGRRTGLVKPGIDPVCSECQLEYLIVRPPDRVVVPTHQIFQGLINT